MSPDTKTVIWSNGPGGGPPADRSFQTFGQPTVPNFTILNTLGSGAMGIVFRARQNSLNREVALKMLRPHLAALPEYLERLRKEAAVVARLRHPNIVPIHEIGEHDGVPYLVFEYIQGRPLDLALRRQPMPPRLAAEIVAGVADALGAAHRAGVVHRDVKPSNIVIDARNVPHLLDFGVAWTDRDDKSLTQHGIAMGTPIYMSPEQSFGHPVNPSSDVYSLGTTFYEMLVGRPPFLGADEKSTLELKHEGEPVPPRSLAPGVPRDLEAICLKCLERERGRRYPTGAELAADLRNWLEGQPVAARPARLHTRAGKWLRRRPLVAGLATLLLATWIGSSLGLGALYDRAERRAAAALDAQAHAERVAGELARLRAEDRVRQAVERGDRGHPREGVLLLLDALAEREAAGDAEAAGDLRRALTAWADEPHRPHAAVLHAGWIQSAGFSPDGALLASVGNDGAARVTEVRSGRPAFAPLPHAAPLAHQAFSRCGKVLCTATIARRAGRVPPRAEFHVWSLADGAPARAPQPLPSSARWLRRHPRGDAVAAVCETGVRFFRLPDGAPLGPGIDLPAGRVCADFSFDPDGARFALASHADESTDGQRAGRHGLIEILPYPPRGASLARREFPGLVEQLRHGADGALWAAASADWALHRLHGRTLEPLAPPMPQGGRVHALEVRSDGLVAIGMGEGHRPGCGEVRLWTADGQLALPPLEHPGPVRAARFGPDGVTLYTGCEDGALRRWCARTGVRLGETARFSGAVASIDLAPQGGYLAAADMSKGSRCLLLRAAPGTAPPNSAAPAEPAEPALLQCLRLTAAHRAEIRLAVRSSMPANPRGERLATLAASPAAGLAARVACAPGAGELELRLQALADGSTRGTLARLPDDGHSGFVAAFAPDGQRLLLAEGQWDAAAARWRNALRLHPLDGSPPTLLPIAPEAELEALALDRAGGVAAYLERHTRKAGCVAFAAGRPVRRFETHSANGVLALDAAGTTLLASATPHAVQPWRVADGLPAGPPLLHPEPVCAAAFAPAGDALVVCGAHEAYLWSWPGRRRLGPPFRARQAPAASTAAGGQVAWSADGAAFAFLGTDGELVIRRKPAPIVGALADLRRRFEAESGGRLDGLGRLVEATPAEPSSNGSETAAASPPRGRP